VRALLVVFDLPPVDCFPYVIYAHEEGGIEQFLAQRPVESFDIGVLIRLARLDVLNCHARRLGPTDEGLAQELRAVVGAQHLGQASFLAQSFKHPYQPLRGNRGVCLDMHNLPVEVIHDIEQPEPLATGQRIGHEV